MKKIIVTSLFILIISACIKCSDKPVDFEKVTETIITRRLLSSATDSFEPNLGNHDKIGITDTVTMKKIVKPNVSVYIYSNQKRIDSLIRYKDSLYIFNNSKLHFFKKKTYHEKGTIIEISKFQYVPIDPMAQIADLYINDSLGIIIYQAKSQWGAFREYDLRYSDLHKKMILDSAFFRFETTFQN
ncbi:hypothetical protein [Flavobacterium akiainvivens]|nr:hypothetical protein [Flavobacterium akiainvivens]SFQ74480.1 hypothetical protein SAMN05444144_12029 [Flavobacterium akiainvivens]